MTLGTWGIAESAYGSSGRSELEGLVEAALESGIRSFDVAPLWGDGLAEEVVGAAIRNRRDECLVFTRVGASRKGDQVIRAFDGPSIEGSIDASRRRLGVDVIDAVMLHDPPNKALHGGEFAKTFAGLLARGTIRAFGISTTSAEIASTALGFGAKVICVPHNLLQPDLVPAILEEVESFGAGVLVRSPLCHGLLTDAGTVRDSYPADDHRSARWAPMALAARRKQAAGFGAAWLQQTPSLEAFALRWALTSPIVASAIIGPRTKEQLRALVAAVTPVDHLEPALYEKTVQVASALGI